MRPVRAVVLLLVLATPVAVQAQRVGLEVSPDTSRPPFPTVRTTGILRDPRWRESLQSALPIRLRFRLEIWQVRPDWFDALDQSFEWETLVEYDPLTDQYTKTVIWRGEVRSLSRFETLDGLEQDLERPTTILLRPRGGAGAYYYTVALTIRTLSEEELDELERFLRGTDDPPRVSVLGRAVRRLLLRFGGMPTQQLEARSGRFRIE
jgi:hypothetical protein